MVMQQDDIARIQELFPDYEIIDGLEHGAQAAVYLVTQCSTGRSVVIKLLREGAIVGVGYRKRFLNEVDLIAQLDHPNIVTMYDYGQTEGYPYYVMKHIQGMSITDYVFTHNLNVRQCVELLLPICDAVAYAHGLGIMHRDIKPSNIIVNDEGHPYLLDFGLGKLLTEDERREELNLTLPQHVVGTIPYMSPEQARGERLDVRSDVYSLAILLYEMICDELPYDLTGSKEHALFTITNSEPQALRKRLAGHERCSSTEVTRDLQAIISKALRKEREARYHGVTGLAEDLGAWLGGQAVAARAGDTRYVLSRMIKRHRWVITTSLLLMTSVGVAAQYRSVSARNKEARQMLEATERIQSARYHDAAGDYDNAIAYFKEALDLVEQESHASPHIALIMEETLEGLARALISAERNNEALQRCEEALQLVDERLKLDPHDENARRRHAEINSTKYLAYFKQAKRGGEEARGLHEQALIAIGQAIEDWRNLLARFPDKNRYHQDLAGSLKRRAYRLESVGRQEESAAAIEEQITILEQLNRRVSRPDLQLVLAEAYVQKSRMIIKTDPRNKKDQVLSLLVSVESVVEQLKLNFEAERVNNVKSAVVDHRRRVFYPEHMETLGEAHEEIVAQLENDPGNQNLIVDLARNELDQQIAMRNIGIIAGTKEILDNAIARLEEIGEPSADSTVILARLHLELADWHQWNTTDFSPIMQQHIQIARDLVSPTDVWESRPRDVQAILNRCNVKDQISLKSPRE